MNIQNFFHILNPNQSHRRSVQKFFKKNKSLRHIWVERNSHPTHLETIMEWSLLQGVTALAVWGGDGSFSRALQALYKLQALNTYTLALVPMGTGNDFARTIGLSPGMKNAARVFSNESQIRKFDLGLLTTESGDRIFVNNAGFGRTPAAVAGKIANPIQDILHFKSKLIQLDWETPASRNVETVRAIMGIVFNGPYFNKGLYFDQAMDPSDGMLNAVLIPVQKKSKLLLRFLFSRYGKSLARSSDIQIEGQTIKMESADEFYPQLDGEPAGPKGVRRMTFEILKGALQLLTLSEAK